MEPDIFGDLLLAVNHWLFDYPNIDKPVSDQRLVYVSFPKFSYF